MADGFERLQQVVPPHYVIERELGRGGMATVYLADDLRHGRQVAIKVLHPEFASIVGRARFEREIAIEATLQHPAIVPLFDSGGDGDVLFYVMPYVAGETLGDRLERERQLPVDEVLRVVREVGGALSYAHGRGIVHRDIKPSNILLSGEHALVTDFGVARAVSEAGGDRITSSGLAVGTPAYMSPEQAAARDPVDQRADVYALGCVVFEMLAGQPPFTGATAQAVLAQHKLERPPSLEVVRPGVGGAVQGVIDKALAKVPADRWQSAAEFVGALERAAASPESWPYALVAAPPPVWRRPWSIGAAVVVTALVAVLALLWPAGSGTALAVNKVVGFPLRAAAGVPPDVAEQVYIVIENAFVHTDPLKWVPGERHLTRGGALPAAVSVGTATAVARRQGCRYWITGTVSAVGDSLTVALELYDAAGDTLVGRAAATGALSAAAYPLGLRAVNALLPAIVGRSTHVDQELLVDLSPEAVAHWLTGEQAYRASRYRVALSAYERALALDSGMAFAALKGAMTAAWLADYPLGATLVAVALAHRARLPERNVRFALGLRSYFEGDGDSALAWFRRALQADPEWSEAWYGVGEAYLHLTPTGTALDSLATDAFERSLAIDPDFAPVIFHLAESELLRGDPARADSLVERHRRLAADSGESAQLDLMRRCVRRGPGGIAWAEIGARFPDEALTAGRQFAGGLRYPDCARAALHAAFASPRPDIGSGRTVSAARGLHNLDIAQGRTARAVAFADSLGRLGGPFVAAYGLLILDAVAGLVPDERAAPGLAIVQVPLASASARHLWWLGTWAVHTRDVARVDSIAARLASLAAETRSATVRTEAQAMAAWSALLRGDTAAALTRFAALRPVATVAMLVYDCWEPLAVERLQLATLLFARGDDAGALRVAGSFDRAHALADLVFLPASLRLRRDAAERLGDHSLATSFSARLAELASASQ